MHAQSAVMGRPRTKDFGLPPRMYRRGARHYYVTHTGRWIPLGTDLARAKRLWADYECVRDVATVERLVARYMADCTGKLAASSRAQYRAYERAIAEQWGSLQADQLQPWMIAQFRDDPKAKPGWSNGIITLLRNAYQRGVEWGWVATSPAAAVKLNIMPTRERYLSDDEYRAIRDAGPLWFQIACDLLYLTAMRPCDLVNLKWSDVGDAAQVRQQKTHTQLAFIVTDALRDVLQQARQRPILGLYVIANDKGRPLSRRRLNEAWIVARTAAGVPDAQVRDVRAKAGTDAEAAGMDYQALLGHANKKMSDRYLKLKRVKQVTAIRARL